VEGPEERKQPYSEQSRPIRRRDIKKPIINKGEQCGRLTLGDGQTREEQTGSPPSSDSSTLSQKHRTGSERTRRDTSSGAALTKSVNISGPVKQVPDTERTIIESGQVTIRKTNLPTNIRSNSEPADRETDYKGRSVLNDATESNPYQCPRIQIRRKGKASLPFISVPARNSSAKPPQAETENTKCERATPLLGSGKQKAQKDSADGVYDTDTIEGSTQGEASDWKIGRRKGSKQSRTQFPDDKRTKSAAGWILQPTVSESAAPFLPPTVPLPTIPGHVEAASDEDADSQEPKLSSRYPSFHPIELDLPNPLFPELTASYTLPYTAQKTIQKTVASGKYTSAFGKHDSVSGNNTINTSSGQALPLQTSTTRFTTNGTRPTSHLTDLLDTNLTFPHTIYPEGDIPPYTHVRQLGHGSLGTVDEVCLSPHHPSHPASLAFSTTATTLTSTFARKCVRLSPCFRDDYLPIIHQEVHALRLLSHPHIVRLAGTYECKPFYSIIMTPVGDKNLKDFLEDFPLPSHPTFATQATWLKTWFSCLPSALAYIHAQGIRHEDIKPSNIIHRGPDIYLTDFSSCTEFQFGMTTSTDTPACRITRVYSAPEAILDNRHGAGTDVFSLGCVFAEMAAVGILQRRVLDLWEHVGIGRVGVSERECRFYCRGLERVHTWFRSNRVGKDEEGNGGPKEGFYEKCIKPMLATERKDRPCAGKVARRVWIWFREEDLRPTCACSHGKAVL
jgi:hypothetical protein